MGSSYDAGSLEILSGLDPVRKRPGMYTDTSSPDHLAQEVIDNSVDEALAGHASAIDVTLHRDQSMSVRDNGRGMPVDKHPKRRCSGVEVILTTLHSGGKFSGRHYRYAGGLHGVGVSVVNALSKHLEVWVRRGGKEYNMAFAHGEAKGTLEEVGKVSKRDSGSVIRFWPEPSFFDSARFNTERLYRLLLAKAILCPGLRIAFHDENTNSRKKWYYRDGMPQYFRSLTDGQELLLSENISDRHESDDHELAWCLNWTNESASPVAESYVNLVPTPHGGSHVNGLRTGLIEAVREFMRFHELTPKNIKLAPDDFWSNVCYLLSLKIENPQFSGQTKKRLNQKQAAAVVHNVIRDALSLWLNRHPRESERIVELALSSAQQRRRKSVRAQRKSMFLNLALPGKLADCTSAILDETELFLVEGDSAGGSARQARDRRFQAVMPLRGKIMNTWEVSTDDILTSQEIHNISTAIGVKPGSENLDALRYGKVCILADADADGLHIATLLGALFMRHFPRLVSAGHIHVAVPPLFRIDVGKDVYYVNNEEERDRCLAGLSQKNAGRARVTRFKGLGEMNPQQLKESTMTVNSRCLLQLVYQPGSSESTMDMLLAKKRAPDRREWLNSKGNLARDLA